VELSGELSESGYAVIPQLIRSVEVDGIARCIENMASRSAGTRCLIDAPWCRELSERVAAHKRVRDVLPAGGVAVQCSLFIKSVKWNWLVALHQDLSIPVAYRVDSPRCVGWSEKEGEVFVQPPVSVLEEILAVRIHVDDCDEQNGALRVVPGSHRSGRLKLAQAHQAREERGETSVSVRRGGAMLMRPLLLHASSKAEVDNPRRVLHFVFGPPTLPEGLSWPSRKRK
jgi:ectoine hydroxylase-related dioxygenase (phytanoyl-CoA dioxygenase family)